MHQCVSKQKKICMGTWNTKVHQCYTNEDPVERQMDAEMRRESSDNPSLRQRRFNDYCPRRKICMDIWDTMRCRCYTRGESAQRFLDTKLRRMSSSLPLYQQRRFNNHCLRVDHGICMGLNSCGTNRNI